MAMAWQNDPAQLAAMQSAAPNATSGNIPDYLKNIPGMSQTLAQNPSVMGHQEQVADPMAAMQSAGNGNDQYTWFNNHPQYQNNIRGAMGAGFSPWYSNVDNNGGAASSGTGLNYGGASMPGRGGPGVPPPTPMQSAGGGSAPGMMSPGDPMQGAMTKMGTASAGMGYGGGGYGQPGMAYAGGGGFNEQTGQRMPMQSQQAQQPQQRMQIANMLRARMSGLR